MHQPTEFEQWVDWVLAEYPMELYLGFYFFSLVFIGLMLAWGTFRQFPPPPKPLPPLRDKGNPPVLPTPPVRRAAPSPAHRVEWN